MFYFVFVTGIVMWSALMVSGQPLTGLKVGAEQFDLYLPLIKNKRVGLVANPTSRVGNPSRHLVDVLKESNVDVKVVFAPEHGFRGEAGAGDKVKDGIDSLSGIRVVSLYGKKNKPSSTDLRNVDVMLFDIQDVGVRFYTYISTLQYVMEACADQGIQVVILDRPNPNGHYVDGPVLDTTLRSFVGMNPIPIVHGCTVGEYAKMLVGEGWLRSDKPCNLKIIPVSNYTHSTGYFLPDKPSPNLPNQNAVYLYPSLCMFEGTRVSLGRGTEFPFETYGFPEYKPSGFSFRPTSMKGVAEHPPYEDTLCYGKDLRSEVSSMNAERWFRCDSSTYSIPSSINLEWLIDAYSKYPEKERFFSPFFDKLAGTKQLKQQVKDGCSAAEIKRSWQTGLRKYMKIRSKYLLYPDFTRK